MEVIEKIPVDFDVDHVLSRLHVISGSADANELSSLVEEVRAAANPKAVFEVCHIGKRTDDTIEINGVVFTSRVLRINFEDAYRVFAYIATSGRELDELSEPGDTIRGYWLAELKQMALEAALDRVCERIETAYRPGKMAAMSPGSLADWPISQQEQLFSLFGNVEDKIGVRLTDNFLMIPMKSISGIFFPTGTSFESCQLCPREKCRGRRAAYAPQLWKERYAKP